MRAKLTLVMLCVVLLAACNNKGKQKALECTPASGYFVKNTVESGNLTLVLKSQDEMDKYFGMATTMSTTPTSIDFAQQHVLAVIGAETDHDTSIELKSLAENNGAITLKYAVVTKDKQTFTIRPCLLLLVDNKHTGEVSFVSE